MGLPNLIFSSCHFRWRGSGLFFFSCLHAHMTIKLAQARSDQHLHVAFYLFSYWQKKKAWNKPLIPDSMLTEYPILLERKIFHISSLHLHDRLIILYLREANHFLQCHVGPGNFPPLVAKV